MLRMVGTTSQLSLSRAYSPLKRSLSGSLRQQYLRGRSHACRYSRLRRAPNSATVSTRRTHPTPWPADQTVVQRARCFSISELSLKSTFGFTRKSVGSMPALTKVGRSQFASTFVTVFVRTRSSMVESISMLLYSGTARLSSVAMNAVPITAKLAPAVSTALISAPYESPPPRAMGPSKKSLTADNSEKPFIRPVCPPAPADTRINPSTPASTAFLAKATELTSASTFPPQACTRSTIGFGPPNAVMTTGTWAFSKTLNSSERRGFVGCTTRFAAQGTPGRPPNRCVICAIHSLSTSMVLAFAHGKLPRTPFAQAAITRSGPDTKNIGAAMSGSLSAPPYSSKNAKLVVPRAIIAAQYRSEDRAEVDQQARRSLVRPSCAARRPGHREIVAECRRCDTQPSRLR